jgi:hypothetical protein
MKRYLRKKLTTTDTPALISDAARAVKGWMNYHNISYNRRRVNSVIWNNKLLLLGWFNRSRFSERKHCHPPWIAIVHKRPLIFSLPESLILRAIF